MATLTANGIIIGSSEVTAPAKSFTYSYSEYSVRTSTGQQSGSSNFTIWTPITFTKKDANSVIIVQGQCIGMDAYSYPYGATNIRLRHSDGSDFRKYAGSQYTHNADGAQTVYWKINVYFTASDLGSRTGSFTVNWDYGDRNGGGGNKPWETWWNWNASDDSRAFQQGSTCNILEVGQ